ncbi:Ig-like domain-containing protein [Bacteroides acidifaciens]|uniref:Ig-like domain-containing protein n=1 Tax=Bacteroides acidifaciens TaxID=85831 RepID=UPI00158E2DC3|nr:Ig-like domain-containing protein [Bacteroides acidifaciens]
MKRDYIKYFVGLAACSLLGLTACDDDKDLGEKMDEMITISAITLEDTQYDAGNKTICLLKNKELQLSWSIMPESATNTNVQWTSSDESVATVTQEGLVMTKDKAGKAIITMTPEIGFGPEATIVTRTVEVMDEYTYMSAINITNVPAEEIAAGDEYQLTVSSEPETTTFKRYKWTSSNPEVATVDEKTGLVTGISKGDATITVTADDFSSNPVSASCEIGVKIVTPITGMTFTEDAELNQLGYGQEYQIKYTLEPVEATASLLTWTSDNPEVISVDKTGKLCVNTMTEGSAVITASYGPVVQTVTVTVAEGRLWYSFGNGLGSWFLDGNGASVKGADGQKTIVQMGGSKWRGDLWLAKNGKGKNTFIKPNEYRYLAVKIKFGTALKGGNNSVGCIKLEVWDKDHAIIGDNNLGSIGSNNNSYTVLGGNEYVANTPNVVYYDLQSRYDKKTPTDWNQTFDLAQFKFVIADFPITDPDITSTYDIYWVRSFKTVEELQAFVDSENNNE